MMPSIRLGSLRHGPGAAPSQVARGFLSWGFAIMEGVLPAHDLGRLDVEATALMAERRRTMEADPDLRDRLAAQAPDAHRARAMAVAAGRLEIRDMPPPWNDPATAMGWFARPPLNRLLAEIFGTEPLALLAGFSGLRHHAAGPDPMDLGFHQDGAAFGEDVPMLIAWMPLTPAGLESTTIQLVAAAVDRLMWADGPEGGNPWDFELPWRQVARAYPDVALWQPVIAPGSVLLMNQRAIHRTCREACMDRGFFSLILRVIRARDAERLLARFPHPTPLAVFAPAEGSGDGGGDGGPRYRLQRIGEAGGTIVRSADNTI